MWCELDSHADTCVVGLDAALVIHDFERPVRVRGYDDSVAEANECKTVSAVTAYDDPKTGRTYMFVIHQAILIERLTNILLSPMQLRDNDVKVNDEPKYLQANPTNDHHVIAVDDPTGDKIRVHLQLRGVTSCFPVRKPSKTEYESANPDYVFDLTSEDVEWDPSDSRFGEQEAAMLKSDGTPRMDPVDRTIADISTIHSIPQPGFEFGQALTANVRVRTKDMNSKKTSVVKAFKSGKRGHAVRAKQLARNWNIGLSAAERTVDATTQHAVRTTLHPTLSRRFATNDRRLRYRRLPHTMFTDTLEAKVQSWWRKNKHAQVFCTPFGWVRCYPMSNKSDAHEGFSLMAQRDGVPPVLVMDGSKEQTLGTFRKKAREAGVQVKQTEPYSPWQNAAESAIRELKRGATRKMAKAKVPKKLWDHCIELEAILRSHTALDHYELQGQVPETLVSGQTADISAFSQHSFYDFVKFWDTKSSYPEDKEVYGRWLGPAMDVGPAHCSKILQDNGHVIYLSTFRSLTEEELIDPREEKLRCEFDSKIESKIGPLTTNEATLAEDIGIDPTPEFEPYEDDDDEPYPKIPDVDDVTPEESDNYLGAEVDVSFGGDMKTGTVVRRARNSEGELEGTANINPILDTRTYEVEFLDGTVGTYSANLIADNMISMCDPNGNQQLLFDEIVDHKFDGNAVKHADRFVTVNGKQYAKKTTAGVKLCTKWKGGSTTWERLADLKEAYPVQVAEYAVAQGIDHEPAFAWWVPYTLKRRDRVIAAVNKRYFKTTHKFGFEVPKTLRRALEIDKENGNTLWADALKKEMDVVRKAFKVLEDGKKVPPGYQFMDCHLVFDVKLEDNFRRKVRLVAGGHQLDQPQVITYSSVVSRESVRIALTMAALHDVQVKTSDIQNAFIQSPVEEKIATVLGPEFGDDAGKTAIIVRALYGLKSASAAFARHVRDCMEHLGWKQCRGDADVWLKPEVREDGYEYYAYVLFYVDDILCVHHDAEAVIRQIDYYFPMKAGSIGDPDIYLGSKLRKVQLDNGVWAWGLSPSKYIQEAVKNVEGYLEKNSLPRLPKRDSGPWPTGCDSALDSSTVLKPKMANYYQTLVGALQWCIELGRVDIITETSLLSSQLALPRDGHLCAAFHVFGYLKRKHNSRMVFDPTYPNIRQGAFLDGKDWKDFYGDIKEAIPPDAPKPRGKEIDLTMFVDSDHAGDKLNRRSRTGFFIYLNSALIQWHSKRQSRLETSVFGSEFIAMKTGIETLRGIRCKLRMMGVPISGPSYIYGDNMSVIHNAQRPESVLKKKSNAICYHACREAVAMGECLTGHIPTGDNVADVATKVVPGGAKREHLVSKLLFDIFDSH